MRSIGDPKIRIVETEWDMTRRNTVLGLETLRAMRECRYPWGIYIQADEVLHERGAEELAAAIQRHDGDRRVEGLLVRYLHFYGGFDTIATHRRWYRREVRAVRLDPSAGHPAVPGCAGIPRRARSTGRSAPDSRPPRCSTTAGHGRRRRCARSGSWGRRCIHGATPTSASPCSPGFPGSDPSREATPRSRAPGSSPGGSIRIASSRRAQFRWRFLRYYVSGAIERLTGVRVFEFRNYTLV